MQVQLTFWPVFFLIASAQGFFLSLVLLTSRKSGKSSRFLLSSLVLSFSVTLLFYVSFWTGLARNFGEIFNTALQIVYLFGPLAFLYVRNISGKKFGKKDLFHFVPFLLVFLLFGITIITNIPFLNNFLYQSREVAVTNMILHNLSLLIYSILILNWVYRTPIKVKQVSIFHKQFGYLFAIFSISYLSYYVLSYTGLLRIEYDYAISVCMSVIIFYIGYKGYYVPEISIGNIKSNGKYNRSGMTEQVEKYYADKLLNLIGEKKVYLNSDLKLSDLSKELEISIHHISQLINSQFNQSFTDLINSFRIKHAIEIMKGSEGKEETLIGIAYASGFNNKVSFNNSFRKFTGLSPSLYKKLIEEGKSEPSTIQYPRIEV